MASTMTTFVKLALVLVVCLHLALIHAAPQLFDDQEGVSDEPYLSDPVNVVEALPLTRTRRGSPTNLVGSFGHHQPTYHHGGGHGHGGHGHGHGGQGWGWKGGPVGPVFTYVRTDYHGNFQWGVRHRAGGHHGR